jgi:hypothetical protein
MTARKHQSRTDLQIRHLIKANKDDHATKTKEQELTPIETPTTRSSQSAAMIDRSCTKLYRASKRIPTNVFESQNTTNTSSYKYFNLKKSEYKHPSNTFQNILKKFKPTCASSSDPEETSAQMRSLNQRNNQSRQRKPCDKNKRTKTFQNQNTNIIILRERRSD